MKPRTEIRDELNKNRLLGSIPRPELINSQPYFRVLMMSRLRDYDNLRMMPPMMPTVDTLDLRLDWFEEDGGWGRRHVFVTMAPLDKLMRVLDFCLPGETDEQANHRRFYW